LLSRCSGCIDELFAGYPPRASIGYGNEAQENAVVVKSTSVKQGA